MSVKRDLVFLRLWHAKPAIYFHGPAHPHMPGRSRVSGTPTEEEIGQRIARLRKERGITQAQLANKLGVSQGNISDYERGAVRLSIQLVVEIARLFGISTDELLGVRPPPAHSGVKDQRILKRLILIDRLPKRDKDALLKTINAFLNTYSRSTAA